MSDTSVLQPQPLYPAPARLLVYTSPVSTCVCKTCQWYGLAPQDPAPPLMMSAFDCSWQKLVSGISSHAECLAADDPPPAPLPGHVAVACPYMTCKDRNSALDRHQANGMTDRERHQANNNAIFALYIRNQLAFREWLVAKEARVRGVWTAEAPGSASTTAGSASARGRYKEQPRMRPRRARTRHHHFLWL